MGNRVKEKAVEKVEERIENKSEEAIDKGLDKTEDAVKKSAKKGKKGASTQKGGETSNEEMEASSPKATQQRADVSYTKYDFVPGNALQ